MVRLGDLKKEIKAEYESAVDCYGVDTRSMWMWMDKVLKDMIEEFELHDSYVEELDLYLNELVYSDSER